jgi:hypothetical protein
MSKRDWVVALLADIIKDGAAQPTPTAEIIVERLTEEGLLHLGYGNAEIDIIVDKFADTFGTTKTSKYDRFAARRLGDKYGTQAVCGIIGLLGQNADARYAPVVGSITQLEEKWVSVLNFLRKQANESEVIDAL